MPQQNVWSVAQDALLSDLAEREQKRLAQEQLARDLEDRAQKRSLVDLQMKGESQRQGFAADSAAREGEEAVYQKTHIRPLKEQEINLALEKAGVDLSNLQESARHASVVNPLDEQSAQQNVDAGQRAAALATQRQSLVDKYRALPQGSSAAIRVLDQIALIDRQLPPSVALAERAARGGSAKPTLPEGVQSMISGLYSAPGMTLDNARRALQIAMPGLLDQYKGLDPNAVYATLGPAFGKQGSESSMDQLLGNTSSPALSDDQLNAILSRVNAASGGRPQTLSAEQVPDAIRRQLDSVGQPYTADNVAYVAKQLSGSSAPAAPQVSAPSGPVVFDPNAPLPTNAGPSKAAAPSMADLLRAFMASQRGTVSQIGR